MPRGHLFLVVLSTAYGPAMADEIADALHSALEAYEAGDVDGARENAEYGVQLLAQQKATGLRECIPDALPGWTRMVGEV